MHYEWLENYQKLEDEIADIEFNLERSKKIATLGGGRFNKSKINFRKPWSSIRRNY